MALSPLTVPEKITERQQGVADFVNHPQSIHDTRDCLSHIQDLERLCARIAYQRANARDLLSLMKS